MEDTSPATKADINEIKATLVAMTGQMVTKTDLLGMATKEDLAGMATKEDLRPLATKADLAELSAREQWHFKYLNENIDKVLNIVVTMHQKLPSLERRIKKLEARAA